MTISDLDMEHLYQDVCAQMFAATPRPVTYATAPEPIRELVRKTVAIVLDAIGEQTA